MEDILTLCCSENKRSRDGGYVRTSGSSNLNQISFWEPRNIVFKCAPSLGAIKICVTSVIKLLVLYYCVS